MAIKPIDPLQMQAMIDAMKDAQSKPLRIAVMGIPGSGKSATVLATSGSQPMAASYESRLLQVGTGDTSEHWRQNRE